MHGGEFGRAGEHQRGDGDAVCALDRGWGAAVRAVDGEAERAANWSSPALRGTTLGCKKTKLGGSMRCREHGGALGALDRSPGVAWVADDDGQEARRRSGGGGGRSKKE
jgi:hypothetical protein